MTRPIESRRNRARKEAERRERERARFATQTAMAAAYQGKSRELAARIRKKIRPTERCPYCDAKFDGEPHLDHIYPVSLGGLSSKTNLVFVCQSCNLSKGDQTLREFIEGMGFSREDVEGRLRELGKKF